MPTRLGIARSFVPAVVAAFCLAAAGIADEPKATPTSLDWPRWRGPNADGVADGRALPVRWSKTENVLWSATLPGWGTSSPVVSGDRVFVTSQVTENDKKSLW